MSVERLAHRPGQRLGACGRHERRAAAHEQRIAEHPAQPGERVAHPGLAQPDPLRRPGHAALAQERVERHEEVEIDPAEIHCCREYRASRDSVVTWSSSGLASRPMSEEIGVLIIGGSLVGLTTAALLGHHGVRVAVRRAPRGHRDPSARRPLPAAHDGDPAPARPRGRSSRDVAAHLPPARRHRRGGVARRARAAIYIAELNEGVEGFSPTRPPVPRPGRARAAAARARARARGDAAQPRGGRRPRRRTPTA